MSATTFAIRDFRAEIAMARVIASFDVVQAERLAQGALDGFFSSVFYADHLPEPCELAYISSDTPLWRCYQKVLTVRGDYRTCLHNREKWMEKRKSNAIEAQSQTRLRRDALAAVTPCALTMLECLRKGQTLDLNGHTLSYDQEMHELSGTNCYGIDYFPGALTLLKVSVWRAAMLGEEVWGMSPARYCERVEVEYDPLDPHTPVIQEIEASLMRLFKGCEVLGSSQEESV